MIGAILGDLAAWTWEKSHSEFYPKLVSQEAKPSTMTIFLIKASCTLMENANLEPKRWALYNGNFNDEQSMLFSIFLGCIITQKIQKKAVTDYCIPADKDTSYACQFLAQIIFALRNGATKNDAAQIFFGETKFRTLTKDKKWHNNNEPIGRLIRAWMAFYDSFDYGSDIHNAMKMSGDRHLNAMLVGALADAMYGCEYYYVKKKYGEGCFLNIASFIPKSLANIHNNRVFFPKNNARANVEKLNWVNTTNPYATKTVSSEFRRRIVKAMYTGWENRFGFYLDDGWEYVYRSFIVINRFKLTKQTDGTYRITNYQTSNSLPNNNIAMQEALYSVEHDWYVFSGEKKVLTFVLIK